MGTPRHARRGVAVNRRGHSGRARWRATRDCRLPRAGPIDCLAIRHCPPWPDRVEDRLRNIAIQTQADGILYRRALAAAAQHAGIPVVEFDPKTVMAEAIRRLPAHTPADHFKTVGKHASRAWRQEHQLAMAAAFWAQQTRLTTRRPSTA